MSKKLKAVLSFALALVLVMSLSVSAFADSSNAETEKEKEKEPEIVQIAFNLGTMEPCAVRMRELGYDDIRIDGVSYRADAKDGVIAINLGDLAAIKLLRENTEKAKELGIDYANLYIRGGKVLVKDDTGLTSDQIAALQQAVASLMSSVRIGVNIGDIFDLSNGEKVKLRVQVSNFIYPPQKETKQQIKIQPVDKSDFFTSDSKHFNTVKATTDEEHFVSTMAGGDGSVPISAKTPTVTTLYFYYEGPGDRYSDGKKEDVEGEGKGFVGIAKDGNDNNTYYIQINYEEDSKEEYKEVKDLTKTKSFGEFWDALISIIKNGKLAQNIKIATDKDGKNVVRNIDIKDATPKTLDDVEAKDSGYKDCGEAKWADGTPITGSIDYKPTDPAKIIKDDGKNASLDVKRDVVSEKTGNDGEVITLEDTSEDKPVVDTCEHTWSEISKVGASCAEDGSITYACTKCNATKTDVIPAHGHVCNENGVCTACGIAIEEPKDEQQGEPKADTPAVQPAVEPMPVVVETPVEPAPAAEPPAPVTESAPEPPVEPAPAPTAETGDAE